MPLYEARCIFEPCELYGRHVDVMGRGVDASAKVIGALCETCGRNVERVLTPLNIGGKRGGDANSQTANDNGHEDCATLARDITAGDVGVIVEGGEPREGQKLMLVHKRRRAVMPGCVRKVHRSTAGVVGVEVAVGLAALPDPKAPKN